MRGPKVARGTHGCLFSLSVMGRITTTSPAPDSATCALNPHKMLCRRRESKHASGERQGFRSLSDELIYFILII